MWLHTVVCWILWIVTDLSGKGDQVFVFCPSLRAHKSDRWTPAPLSLQRWWRISFLPLHIQQFPLCLPYNVTFFIVLCSSLRVSSFYLHNYTRVLLYTLLTPATFVSFLYCVVFFSKLYSSSFRLYTTYAIFFYSPLLSPPFHFPFLRNYEMDLAFIRKSFAALYMHSITAHELSR